MLSVTMEPYRYVVEAVAGDDWEVRSIVPKGGNPETFDPAPGDIMLLSESRACFLVGGLGFERDWKDKMAVLYPKMTLVDTSRGIERDAGDPHLWTSPDNMIKIADNVCNALCKIDSTRYYTAKAAAPYYGQIPEYEPLFLYPLPRLLLAFFRMPLPDRKYSPGILPVLRCH